MAGTAERYLTVHYFEFFQGKQVVLFSQRAKSASYKVSPLVEKFAFFNVGKNESFS